MIFHLWGLCDRIESVIEVDQMMFLLSGTDNFLIRQNTDAIIDRFKIGHDDIEIYDMEEILVQAAVENAMTIPFLSEKKAVVLTNASFLSAIKIQKPLDHNLSVLENYVKNPNPSTVLIVQAPYDRLDRRQNLTKTILDHMELIECNPETNEDIFQQIKDQLSRHDLKIDANSLQVFVSRVGGDRGNMFHELDKLIDYAQGKDQVTADMIKEVVYRNPEDHVYQLVNAIINDDRQMLIHIFNDLLEANIDPVWILKTIATKVQEILYTKELLRLEYKFEDIMKYFSANKGRTYFIIKNANSVSNQRMEDLLAKLEKLDSDIKTGKIYKQIGLELFIMRMYA